MARKDGFIRLVQKRMPQGSTPSVPLSDDHTDGTWTYKDLYDGEIAINDTGEFYYRSLDTIYTFNDSGAGATGSTGPAGATGPDGYRAVMNLSYTGSSLTLGLGTITLPIGVPINNLGWQQGTRVRVFNDATHYMEGQITSVITNPQTTGINVNVDYVVGSGSFGVWNVGIAGDVGSSATAGATPSLSQVLAVGATANSWINLGQSYGVREIGATGSSVLFNSSALVLSTTDGVNTPGINLYKNGLLQLGTTNGVDGCLFLMKDDAHAYGTGTVYLDGLAGRGIQYYADYSTGYTNRSLVDKEYVDNALSSATLDQVLTNGNNTGVNDIVLANNAISELSSAIVPDNMTGLQSAFTFELNGGLWNPAILASDSVGITSNFTNAYFKAAEGRILSRYDNGVSGIGSIETFGDIQVGNNRIDLQAGNSIGSSNIGSSITLTASEISYSIFNTAHYDPYYSAIGTIGTEYTTFGNEYISPNPGFPDYHRRGSFNSKSGPASGNETWAEVRSENVNGTSYAYIRATDLGGAYPANILQVGDVSASDFTSIEHNMNKIEIKSSNTGFYGIEYYDDWSANFTNRSLVDKEYVDNAVAGGGGGGGITYSGLQNYTTYFDTDNSLDYTDTYYNSGRTTFGLDPYYPWMWDQVGKLNVYFPQSIQPAIIAEGGQFGGMFIAADNTAGGQLIGLQSFAHGSQVSGNLGLYSRADGTQSNNIGGQFSAFNGVIYPGYGGYSNLGVAVEVSSVGVDPSIAGVTNSGFLVNVVGRAGDNNYIGQFQDGSEGAGKVLTCIDGTGLATWQTPTPSGGGGTVSQILTQVRNQSGSTMYRGMVVYISGSTGTLPLVTLSQANSEATSARTYGIIRDDISNNGTGYVVAIGAIENLDTRTTATNPFTVDTLADGNRLYLSPTNAGYVTNVKPSAPNHMVYIGTVIRTSPTAGYIEYQIQNGYELDELHDVSIPTTPTDGQVLTYEVSTSLWKAKTVSGGATPSLSAVLQAGNSAGTYSINLNNNNITGGATISTDTMKILAIGTGSSHRNLGLDNTGKVIQVGNSSNETFVYSFANGADSLDFYNDENVRFGWDAPGNDLEFYMDTEPAGGGDLRALATLNYGTQQNTFVTTVGVLYDLYGVGVASGSQLTVIIVAETDLNYPIYQVDLYNASSNVTVKITKTKKI